MQDKFE